MDKELLNFLGRGNDVWRGGLSHFVPNMFERFVFSAVCLFPHPTPERSRSGVVQGSRYRVSVKC